MLGLPERVSAVAPRPGPRVVPLSALFRFLEDPLQGSARFRLRLGRNEEPQAEIEDEPFDMDRLSHASLVRNSVLQTILASQGHPGLDRLLATYERLALAAELRGSIPTGLFRRAGAPFATNLLRAWHPLLPRGLGNDATACRYFRLVRQRAEPRAVSDAAAMIPEAAGEHTEQRPAVRFTLDLPLGGQGLLDSVDIIVEGRTGLWASSSDGGEVALSFTCAQGVARGLRRREELRAFLEYVALVAAGGQPSVPHRSALYYPSQAGGAVRFLRLGPLAPDRARAYLADLCTDLLVGVMSGRTASGVHPYVLPHEAVFSSRQKGLPITDAIASLCDDEQRSSFSSLYGPVDLVLERYTPPTEPEAARMVERRFGLFFQLAVEEEP